MQRIVTIIVPTFGRQRQVSEAVASVMRQSAVPDYSVEVIVVDDASSDPIDLNDFPSIEVYRHAENRGAAAARNTGIQAAEGELIAFLDSDDVWLPSKLANQIALFEKLSRTHDPDLLVVGSGFYDPDRKTGKLRARMPMDASAPDLFASGCWFAPGSSVLMSRQAFEIVGPQDDNLRRLEDLDWFIRFGQAGGKYFCTDTHDILIHPSGNAPFDAVMTAVHQLISIYGPSGTTPLPPRAWNRLAAYLALEKTVAHLNNEQPMLSILEAGISFVRKPRFRPSLERFWLESYDVPLEVQQTFAQLLDARAQG